MPSPWVPAGSGGGLVDSVSGAAPVTSTGGINPIVGITAATDLAPGSLSAADKTKLDGLAPGAAVASVGATAPITSTGGTTPVIAINPATDSLPGSLSAADKTKLDNLPEAFYIGSTQSQSSDVGIALSGVLNAFGLIPPQVTMSGTSSSCTGLRVQISTGGAVGTAKFDYSIDGGATWIETSVTTGAAVALHLGANGLTLNFNHGTYSTTNVYQAVIAGWYDQSGGSNHWYQYAYQCQPLYAPGALDGFSSVKFDGSDDWLRADLNAPAPAVTPFSFTLVQRQTETFVPTLNDAITGATTPGSPVLLGFTDAVKIVQFCGSATGNGNGTLNSGDFGQWGFTEGFFNADTTDHVRAGSVTTTGTDTGGGVSTGGRELGAWVGGTRNSATEVVQYAFYLSPDSGAINIQALQSAEKYGVAVQI